MLTHHDNIAKHQLCVQDGHPSMQVAAQEVATQSTQLTLTAV